MVERLAGPRTMPTARMGALGERLLSEKRISAEQHELALAHQHATGCRIEDALIEVEAIAEPDLLKYLASLHRTRFVSTERLAKADIDRATLDKIPKRLADRLDVLPVLFDASTNTLSVVTADPHNVDALEQVQKGAGVREVKALLGRPAAVHAAVSKFYRGDPFAFMSLENKPKRELALDLRLSGFPIEDVQPEIPRAPRALRDPRSAPSLGALDMPSPSTSRPTSAPAPRRTGVPSVVAGVDLTSVSDVFVETVSVLVNLLENSRPGLRGHSGHVARLVRKMTERIGLPLAEANAMVVAAHLHDLGKSGGIHLTAYNVAELEPARDVAQKRYAMPARMMASAKLAPSTSQALDSMYERYDGRGFPSQLAGKQIPLGARLIAIIDSFLDLTENPNNVARKKLDASEACTALATYKGSVFDPDLLDLFRASVTVDDQKARLLVNGHVALIVDADFEETTVLELRMMQEGFDVRIARTFSEARELLERGGVELVVSELDLSADPASDPEPELDGLGFLAEARRAGWGSEIPWLVLTRRAGHDSAQRALALGAIDYVLKPAITDVLVAKLKNAMLTRKAVAPARGISGSLGEMSLADVVQVLWHGRKSGALRLRRGAETGEVHIAEGRVVNAIWGKLQAEEAFYAMLRIGDGDFSLDPNYKAEEVRITAAPETLLLEGMRRMDEA
jgi:response regulator RpfG family c-di-GMP phosphodiesterase